MTFDFHQYKVPNPLSQLQKEWINDVEVDNFLSTRAKLWRRTNHCVNRSVSFPTLLVFKLNNALSRWKSRLKMPRI